MNPFAAAGRMWSAVKTSLANPQRASALSMIGGNNANVRVTHDIAMQVAAVWACIDVIASALSSSDWNVYAGIRGADKKQALPDDALQYILNTRMNPEMSAQAGKRALGIAAVGYGNGIAEIERDMAGRIVRLWPIPPDRVEIRRDIENGRLVYRVTQDYGGGFVDLDPDDVFHIRGSGLTGVAGDDVVGRAIQSIAMAVALDQFAAAYFSNGTQFGGMITHKSGKMSDQRFEALQKQFNDRGKGPKKAFAIGILEGDVTYQPMTSDAEKSQLIEAKHLSVEEICRWFRVPPHKIAHLLRSTNNNIEHQGLEFTRDTLRAWIKEIEQECDYKLIAWRGQSKFVELDVDWAEQGDYGSRMAAYKIGRDMGAFSANDILRKLGENTIGPAGDIRIVQGANVRLEDVGIAYAQQAPEPEDDDEEADEAADDDDAEADEPDAVLAAWVASVYARVSKFASNRETALKDQGVDGWKEKAALQSNTYAREQVLAMGAVLGRRKGAVEKWACRVAKGTEPKTAAAAALGAKP
jgi:HK97 family phage portal protein